MILLLKALILFLSIGSLSGEPTIDISKLRDKILEVNPDGDLEIGIMYGLFYKLRELSMKPKYQEILAQDRQLNEDVQIILSSLNLTEEEDCAFSTLEARIYDSIDRKYRSLRSLLHQLDRFYFSRCLFKLDQRLNSGLGSLSRNTRRFIKQVNRRSKLIIKDGEPDIPISATDGSSSANPMFNYLSRRYTQGFLLALEETTLEAKKPIQEAEFIQIFDARFEALVRYPCNHVFEFAGLTFHSAKLIRNIRILYGISRFPDVEDLILYCSYLEMDPEAKDRIRNYYIKYLLNLELRHHIEDVAVSSSRLIHEYSNSAYLMTTGFLKDELTWFDVSNPYEFSRIIRRIDKFGKVSRSNCIKSSALYHLIEVKQSYHLFSLHYMLSYLKSYYDYQMKLCEEYLWQSMGHIISETSFKDLLQMEQLKRLVRNNREGESKGTIWLDSTWMEAITSFADLFYLQKWPLEPGSNVTYELEEYIRQFCLPYTKRVEEPRDKLERVLRTMFLDITESSAWVHRIGTVVLDARAYDRLCLLAERNLFFESVTLLNSSSERVKVTLKGILADMFESA